VAPAIKRLLVLAAVGAVAFLAFFVLDRLTDRGPAVLLSRPQMALLIALSLLTVYAILALHECGHLLGSWIVGLRFRSLTVGPVTLFRREGRLHVRRNLNLGLFRGVVRFEAGSDEPGRRLAVVLAAGPLASIGLGVIAALLATSGRIESLAGFSTVTRFMLYRLIALFASGSIAVGLANLIPMRFAGGSSDGARLWALLRRPSQAPKRRT
jgi:hypothetical protein